MPDVPRVDTVEVAHASGQSCFGDATRVGWVIDAKALLGFLLQLCAMAATQITESVMKCENIENNNNDACMGTTDDSKNRVTQIQIRSKVTNRNGPSKLSTVLTAAQKSSYDMSSASRNANESSSNVVIYQRTRKGEPIERTMIQRNTMTAQRSRRTGCGKSTHSSRNNFRNSEPSNAGGPVCVPAHR